MKYRSRILSFAVALTLSAGLLTAAEKETEAERWNLADIFPTHQAWETAKAEVSKDVEKVSSCKGELTTSADSLANCLTMFTELRKRFSKVAVYASMLSDEDTRKEEPTRMRQEVILLSSKYGQQMSYVRPELLANADKVRGFMASPKLKDYRHDLDDILRMKEHVRTPEIEALLASFGPVGSAAGSIYNTFANAEMPWPTITLKDGTEVRLDQAAYNKYRQAPDREDRKKVFDEFWNTWKKFERTLGQTYSSAVTRDSTYAKARKYPSSLAAALDGDNISEDVYRTLIKSTNENLGTLHRYFKLRGKILGISGLRYYDIYPDLVQTDKEFPYSVGKDLTMGALSVFGKDYVDVMKKGFAERWIDVYPRPGKRSGAYMNGGAYGIHPYLLMNYNSDFDGVSTLAHEYGHAMHTYFSQKAQPYPTSGYATFVAEVASIANEHILVDYMLKNAKSDEEKLLYLGQDLEAIRGSFFRQAMFAEFEMIAHDMVDSGKALTGAELTKIYAGLLKKYHGDENGVLKIDDLYAIEWAFIPHFYRNFYVFQYSTSTAAAALLSEAILQGKPGAAQRYRDLLSAGSSKYPVELLKDAGVDMNTPEPYLALMRRANRVMDEIEAIIAKRKQ